MSLDPNNPLARFVKTRLEPERAEGDEVYVLNDQSVSPTAVKDMGELGGVIEETIPTAARSAKFVDKAGNVCDVALRTGRVLSMAPSAQWYEQYMLVEQLKNGSIPLDACPFTRNYGAFTGRSGPLIKEVTGVKSDPDCPGAVGGCVHMKQLITNRRTANHAKWKKDQIQIEQLSKDQVSSMMEGAAESFGVVLADVMQRELAKGKDAIKGARGKLQGDGEKDA